MTTTIKSFLDEIFVDGDPGQIIFAKKNGNQGFIRVGSFNTIAEAEPLANTVDLYFKVNRMYLDRIVARNKHGIGGKEEVACVRVISLDVDTAKKDPKYPPRDTVLSRMDLLMQNPPSLIVSSDGSLDGGLHLYYILDQPVIVDNAVWDHSVTYLNAIARQLREELADILPEYQVDHCENVERLLRVAGGLRVDGRKVEVLASTGVRYSLDELIRYPIEPGDCLTVVENTERADSPILDYLELQGITTVEDYLRDRMGWRQLDATHWIRPGSESGMPTGETFQGVNGEWGITIKSGNAVPLEQMTWYSLAHLYTTVEFGGDWRMSGAHARNALRSLDDSSSQTVFNRYYAESDKYAMNDRAAAIWCYERIDNILYVPDKKVWLAWNGSAWVPANERLFETVSRCMLDVSVEHKQFAKLTDPAERMKRQEKWTMFYRGYLNTKQFNGLKRALESTLFRMSSEFYEGSEIVHSPNLRINLRTGERLPASVEYLNTQTLKVDPADAKCPRWLAFLYEITGGDFALMGYLQRIAGYCLTGDVSEQVMFLLYGSGQNGKSVFTSMIEYILNDYAVQLDQSAIVGVLDQHPTALASLHRKRLALASETDVGCTLREHIVKRLTGTDRLTARRMREDFWEFTPTHKLILSTNNMPIIKGSDIGIWRRLRVINLDVFIPNTKRDKSLLRKLKLESPGILNWMLEGARQYLAGGLQTPRSVEAATDDLRQDMDLVGSWIEDNCELAKDWNKLPSNAYERDGVIIPAADFETPAAELYDNYKAYCQRLSYPCMSATAFGRRLRDKGLQNVIKSKKRLRYWEGIITKSAY